MMHWYEETIVWEDSEHSLSTFGVETETPVFDDDPLHARPIVIWKKQTLGEIIKRVSESASEGLEYAQDSEAASGFALAVIVLNLLPVHVKLVKENEHAFRFLELLKSDDSGDYFERSDLDTAPEIEHLIHYFLKHRLLREDESRLVIQGRVLKSAFLQR